MTRCEWCASRSGNRKKPCLYKASRQGHEGRKVEEAFCGIAWARVSGREVRTEPYLFSDQALASLLLKNLYCRRFA